MQIHHRVPRRMGGSRDPRLGSAENGVLLCVGCHAWVESHREEARAQGLLASRLGDVVESSGSEGDGLDEVVDDGAAPAEVFALLNGSPLLLGDDVDEAHLNVSEVPETLDGIGDGVEVGGDGLGQ